MKLQDRFSINFKPYRVASQEYWNVSINNRKGILKLDCNEATILPSPKVHERITDLISSVPNYNLYSCTYNKELHALIANYAEVPTDNIQYFAGSDELHENVLKLVISKGETVLILGPTYDNFRLNCEALGGKVKYSNFTNDFIFSEEVFESDISKSKPSLIYICNPNNPTGNLLSLEIIERLLLNYSDIIFLIDEAYFEFTDVTTKDLIFIHENLIISRTMSKAFALASFRIGYLLSCPNNIQTISRIKNPKNFTVFSQVAAIAALSDIPYMKDYVNEVNLAKHEFKSFIKTLNSFFQVFNDNGNFLLIRILKPMEKEDLISYLMVNNIFVRDFTHSTQLLDCFRITIGTREQMKIVEHFIRLYYEKYNKAS